MTTLEERPTRTRSLTEEIIAALDTVIDPELDEPITDLKFVRSIAIDDAGVEVHLRLPTAFCSPNFAYLMASDALDALEAIDDIGVVRVMLDDHHDSDKINAGLAAHAGYRGTFGDEAEESLDELRLTFMRKAHTAAMERCLTAMIRSGDITNDAVGKVLLRDIPSGQFKTALLRRRVAIGLSACPNSRVLVDDHGHAIPDEDIPVALRFARSVRISIEGNGHWCRGVLATRYDDGEQAGVSGPIVTNTREHS